MYYFFYALNGTVSCLAVAMFCIIKNLQKRQNKLNKKLKLCHIPPRLKLSPSPSSRVTVARISGSSSSRSSKRKRLEAQDISEAEESELLVSEEATASAGVSISPTDMEGKAVTLVNENEQVRPSRFTED